MQNVAVGEAEEEKSRREAELEDVNEVAAEAPKLRKEEVNAKREQEQSEVAVE